MDKILASVQLGQTTARVDDMEILVSNLQTWRNQLAGLPSPKLAFDGSAPTWPAGNVYYAFSNNVSTAKQKAVLDGAAEWATFANLHFLARSTQTNYITFRENDSLGGGQSAVGMIGGQQFTEFGSNAWNRGTICHEIGHALGLIHEHQRSDRDSYVVILTNNIAGGIGNFPKLANSRNQGAYDFLSIMHYARNSLSLNPATLDTIEPLPPYIQYLNIMGVKVDPPLSPLDRAGMAAIYGAAVPNTNVVTNTQDSGWGSLRAALYYAFDNPGTTISFNIPTNDPGYSNGVFTIQLSDILPSLLNNTTLDGITQPNASPTNPIIVLTSVSPPLPGTYPCGLRFHGTNSVVKGMTITGFPAMGILVEQGASSNRIGGIVAGQPNIISANGQQGVVISDTNSIGNVVQGNYIGLDATGTMVFSNGWDGVGIYNGAQANLILSNVLSGNGNPGIRIGGANNNIVQGNLIGLNASGTAALPNGWYGVGIYGGSQSNQIGGPLSSQRNVIAGNSQQGVLITDAGTSGNIIEGNYVGLNRMGSAAISNTWEGVGIWNGAGANAVLNNVISGNAGNAGIRIGSANNNIVQGNLIGLNASGTAALPNGWHGIGIYGSSQSNLIGGSLSSQRNVIAGNSQQGVLISDTGTIGNTIQGNYIGLNAAGTVAISNTWEGVGIWNGAGANSVLNNVISGNGLAGIPIGTANGNVIQGNLIGLNINGTIAIPNGGDGVILQGGAQSNLIGGTLPSQRNVISGNLADGVGINGTGSCFNVVWGNYIGLNSAGSVALANNGAGIWIGGGAQSNLIGGPYSGMRNIISGNSGDGLNITDSGTGFNFVKGNTLGLSASAGVAIPNAYTGIALWGGAVGNQIGGTNFGDANLIVSNQSSGIHLFDAGTTNNTVRGNSLYGNTGDSLALYNNANRNVAAPILASAVTTTSTTVSGNLTSLANAAFQIDFYSSPTAPAQGANYLGATNVTTSAGGSVSFTAKLAGHVPAGRIITATATDPAGNTSGMSGGVTVTAPSSVNDGIPDAWRAQYFGGSGTTTNSQSCATCDPDHDGMNNLQEFLAGTNPTNAASVLKLNALPSNASNNVASFLSAPGTVYRVLYRDDLASGFWSIAADQIVGTNTNIFIADPSASSTAKRFYRLQVLW